MLSGIRAARGAAIVLAILLGLTPFLPLSAHDDHDHAASAPPPAANVAPRAEVASDLYELVAVAQSGELVLYLDDFASNAPVEGASVEVKTPSGTHAASSKSGTPYHIHAPWTATPGSYDLDVTVTRGGRSDLLPLTLVIPVADGHEAETAAGGGIADWLRHNLLLVLVAGLIGAAIGYFVARRVRRPAGVASMLVLAAMLAGVVPSPSSAHDGQDGASDAAPNEIARDAAKRLADGAVFMPKSTQRILAVRSMVTQSSVQRRAIELPGRVMPDPNASGYVQASVGGRLSPPAGGFPRLGSMVKKGDVLAYVEPPIQAIDLSDMRQRQGELDQQMSIVERRLARYETLVPGGAVPRSQLEDTRIELQGLKDRRAALDKARREPEALIAPVDGVIAEGVPVAGQIAPSNAVIFNVVDPARLWVEALTIDAVPQIHSAFARSGQDRSYPLSFRGSGFAGRNQSIPVQFAVEGDNAGLHAGQFVTVLVTTAEERTGIAVPRAAIVRSGSGQDVVYEHVSAEQFVPRVVRTEPLDGERVFVASGLDEGHRIVVQGAELLGQVR
ncbi:MAG: RND transporter [Afipia sp.]|nr:RND transporter [Afipia sp.]OJW64485.1 MAG: hypothetical protein BGO65_16270 [Afipia sp. 64-13]